MPTQTTISLATRKIPGRCPVPAHRNTVQGSQWSDSWSTDNCGNSYQPTVSSSSYGPDVSAGAGMSVAPVGQPNGGFYYSKTGLGRAIGQRRIMLPVPRLSPASTPAPSARARSVSASAWAAPAPLRPPAPPRPCLRRPRTCSTPRAAFTTQGQLTKITTRASSAPLGLERLRLQLVRQSQPRGRPQRQRHPVDLQRRGPAHQRNPAHRRRPHGRPRRPLLRLQPHHRCPDNLYRWHGPDAGLRI